MRTDTLTAHDSRERGITLIELMVALALFGLIAVLLASGTRLSLDAASRGDAKAQIIRTEKMQRNLVRNQLQGALPFRYWSESENRRDGRLAFDGESGHIRFVSRDGIVDGPNSLPRWVDLRWSEANKGVSKLIIEEHRILPPDNQPSETTTARAELLSCSEPRFEYLDTTGEKAAWLPAWTGTERKAPLPFAVRIQCKTTADPVRLLVPLDYADPARQGLVNQ